MSQPWSLPALRDLSSLRVRLPKISSPTAWPYDIILSLIGVAIVIALASAISPFKVWTTLGDTDDATRLIEVRALLDGQSWFDMTIAQFGAKAPYVSHWSRLVDLPLALALWCLELFFPSRVADTILRWVWPILPLFALFWLTVRTALREAGKDAALYALVLTATSQVATFQFFPGRIDHHNFQILGTVGGIFLLYQAFQGERRASVWAGRMFAVAVAIGYEAMPLVVAVILLASAIAAFDTRYLPASRDMFAAFALGLLGVFVLTVAPWNWGKIACDALSLNFVALTLIGAGTVAAVTHLRAQLSLVQRFGLLAGGGLAGVAVFGSMETACLAGPMGQIDPAIKPIWLDGVREGKSIFKLAESHFPLIPPYLACVGLGFGLLARRAWLMRTAPAILAAGAMLIAALYGCIYVKLMPYPVWLGMAVIACAIPSVGAIGSSDARTARLLVLTLASHPVQLALAAVLLSLSASLGLASKPPIETAKIEKCLTRQDQIAVAQLKPGLILGDIDLGPHIAAHSKHRVVAAPYHRMAYGLKLYDRLRKSDAAGAHAKLIAAGIDYIALCLPKPTKPKQAGARKHAPAKGKTPLPPQSLVVHLIKGRPVPGIEPVALAGASGNLKVWRVLR